MKKPRPSAKLRELSSRECAMEATVVAITVKQKVLEHRTGE